MTNNIKISLNEHSKLTKSYYKNGQKKGNYEKLLENFSDCIIEILEAKINYILEMTAKVPDPKTAAKMYWATLTSLLFKRKKFQQYHLYLLMANLTLIFVEKQIFLITVLHQYVHQ